MNITRRHALGFLAAAGASVPVPLLAQGGHPRRIDTHHHLFPPGYLQTISVSRDGRAAESSLPSVRDWTPERSLEDMDKNGIETAIVSIGTAGVWVTGAAQARTLSRKCNEYAAQLVRDFPGRFGFFAVTPLPDVDGTLKEIEYALDTLKADGVGFLTSYDGQYPGDPAFAPVFEELNRRQAVAYFHPASPTCCRNVVPWVPTTVVEYPHDTTHAILSFLFNGSFAKYRGVKFLWSHAGGTLTPVAGRIENQVRNNPRYRAVLPDGAVSEFRRLYYDIANASSRPTLAALTNLVPDTQIVFGSDYPFIPGAGTVGPYVEYGLAPELMRAIDRDNAARLLPRFRV